MGGLEFFVFIIVLIGLTIHFRSSIKKEETLIHDEVAALTKEIEASVIVDVEVENYRGENVYLGFDTLAHRFLGQGMSEKEMLTNVFKRFPNKERIVYGAKGSEEPVKIALKEGYV